MEGRTKGSSGQQIMHSREEKRRMMEKDEQIAACQEEFRFSVSRKL